VVGNTGFSPPQLLRSSRLFEADPSPGLWPPPFGLKGRRFDGQAKRLLYSGQTWTSYAGCPSLRGNLLTGILNSWGNPPECRPLEKGRAKGAGWIDGITPESSAVRQPTHPKGKGSLHSQSPAAPYSTAISDSQQFVRCFAPPNCVRCCDCSSLRTANAVPQSPAR
jgi:hypothetical protein